MKVLLLGVLLSWFVLSLVDCSSLKGHKDVDHLKGQKGHKDVEHELPLPQQERCHQEYDDVWEEKCQTVYEDKCTVEHK